MSAETQLRRTEGEEGIMSHGDRWRKGRLATLALAGGLLLVLAGDRGVASVVPAAIYGQDPLEVLSLQIRPNVVIVLDSSGSMTSTDDIGAGVDTGSGDHPRSKLYQAKQVLKTFVQQNQDKASFMFANYTQFNSILQNRTAGAGRFQYTTSSQLSPSMVAPPGTELIVQRAELDTGTRGFQSWQIIDAQWSTLYFEEDSTPDAICTAVLPGPFPRFFRRGADLAAALQSAMNAASCTGVPRANTYTVTYDPASGRFNFRRNTGSRPWRIMWGNTPNNIRNALAETSTAPTGWTSGSTVSTDAPWTLALRAGSGSSGFIPYEFTEPVAPIGNVTFYQVRAGRLWNGETIRVQADGTICGLQFATPADRTNPPSVTLQLVNPGCGGDIAASRATFTFGGADFSGNGVSCRGMQGKVSLIPCDLQSPPAPLQITTIAPYIDNSFAFNPDGSGKDYAEAQDGGWAVSVVPPATTGGARADGWTPIANSLIDIKGAPDGTNACLFGGADNPYAPAPTTGPCVERNFQKWWNQGQAGATSMAGPPPYQLDAIKNHVNPKERTIVLFVTDGDDTCGARGDNGTGSADPNALRAAYYAARLYQRIDPLEPASSVITFVIGYGGGTQYRLDWIAWGGSGLDQALPGQPDVPPATGPVGPWTGTQASIQALRNQCSTCQDAFIAPDATTLARQLQSIIEQGAQDGEFTAQQSITDSIYEYVDAAGPIYDARSPSTRYKALAPTKFVSSFGLPGFRGHLRTYQNSGGVAVLKWSAGDTLWQKVSTGMTGACPANGVTGALLGECSFPQLHGGATDATIAGSSAAIKRRVYTTDRNGVYNYNTASLIAGVANNRTTLWPPAPSVAPADYTSQGLLDLVMGLPPSVPTSFPPQSPDGQCDPTSPVLPKKPFNQCWFETLQRDFGACAGSNLPAACTAGAFSSRMLAARRESREMMLAFMAGSKGALSGGGPKRSLAASGPTPANAILYSANNWMLPDSTLATAAVVAPPLPDRNVEPTATPYVPEYRLYRDGPRDGSGKNPDIAGTQLRQGFGLANPDDDNTVGSGQIDTRNQLKPQMTVVYAPANDMLHAFRAGPNCGPSTAACAETGGEELWGFVPYDQINSLYLRLANEPQGRDNHVYVLARGVRFSDVFVPGPLTNVNIGGVIEPSIQGVWRRVLYFGRGIAGKHLTALDVTGTGPFTATALGTQGPIPLWSRGNPDTADGTPGGTLNNNAFDRDAYARMGETWSLPAVAYVDKAPNVTARTPGGVDYVVYVGSGYSGVAGEGSTFYTLDALTGDVVAAPDVETVASSFGLTRTLSYANALPSNAVAFNPRAYCTLCAYHPAEAKTTRVYFGDIHGRAWKVLTARPDVAIPIADVGEDQPIGTPVSLIGMPPSPDTPVPFIFASAGNELRATGPFKNFAFRDDGADTDIAVAGTAPGAGGITMFLPVVSLFTRQYDQGLPVASCGYTTEAVFRGTVQPATTFECASISGGVCQSPVLGRVFFAGTRLSLPNTVFAPPTPLACGTGQYPCRSSFDSIVYALGAVTGNAAYDLNSTGDDAYRIFRDSRITAIQMLADPDPGSGGARFNVDEGLVKGTPQPPPPPGVPPTSTTATASVLRVREPGYLPPSVHFGSSVCQ